MNTNNQQQNKSIINNFLCDPSSSQTNPSLNEQKLIDIQKVKNIVFEIESKLNNLLESLGWNKEELLKIRDERNSSMAFLKCPYDKNHDRISVKNYQKHVNQCEMKVKSYTKQDIVSIYFQN